MSGQNMQKQAGWTAGAAAFGGGLLLGFAAALMGGPRRRARRADPPEEPLPAAVEAAVEAMVAARLGGLDERITEQVRAIELLRDSSAETDALLERLIVAVTELAEQRAENVAAPGARQDSSEERGYPPA